jgi:hypothetical protein
MSAGGNGPGPRFGMGLPFPPHGYNYRPRGLGAARVPTMTPGPSLRRRRVARHQGQPISLTSWRPHTCAGEEGPIGPTAIELAPPKLPGGVLLRMCSPCVGLTSPGHLWAGRTRPHIRYAADSDLLCSAPAAAGLSGSCLPEKHLQAPQAADSDGTAGLVPVGRRSRVTLEWSHWRHCDLGYW